MPTLNFEKLEMMKQKAQANIAEMVQQYQADYGMPPPQAGGMPGMGGGQMPQQMPMPEIPPLNVMMRDPKNQRLAARKRGKR